MKKVVAALVVMAMILAMAPSVFAVAESGGFMLEGGTPYEWTAEYTGTATLSGEPAVNIMVNNGSLGMGPNPTFDVVEGTTYTVQHFGEGFAWIAWEIEIAGSNVGGDTGATSGSIDIEAYGNADWTAPQDGTVKFTISISGASLTILNGFSPLAEGTDSVTAQVTAGTTYLVAPGFDVTTDSVVTWEYVTGGEGGNNSGASEGIPSGGALALGDNNVSLTYATMPAMAPYWTYTATENGYLTVTVSSINGNSELGMAFGRGMYTLIVGDSDGQYTNTATVSMNANDTVQICVLDNMDMTEVPAVINVAFATGEPAVEKNPADYFDRDPESGHYIIGSLESPVEIFVGNDDICYTYTAESAGTVAVTPSVEGMTATNCWIKVNDDAFVSYTEPVTVAAGDVVVINIWNGYEGTVTMTAGEGGSGGATPAEKNPADYFDRDPESGYYIIGSLESPVEIFVGNDDICYTYTAESAGTVAVTPSVEGMTATNCWIKVNENAFVTYTEPVTVAAGDVVVINIWSGYEGTVSMGEGGGNAGGGEGGSAVEGIPSGSALALGDNNVALTYANMPAMAPYWTYTATENGYLTVTVTEINGNTFLGMPFGMGVYTLVVGESDGMGSNTVTVYMNANDTMNVAVLDTMDMEAVPAVLNLSFVAGAPIVEKNPADYFDRDPESGHYIIGSLESAVNIFVGNDDICYTYTAETAGTVTVTPTVDGYTATNCWIKVNEDAFVSYTEPVTVAAGDVVTINIWNGYEGTVTMTAGSNTPGGNPGGEEGENVLVQSGTEQVTETGAVEFLYTPDADGVLTVDISADPGFRFWVYNAATDESLTLPENGTAGQYSYNLEAGVTYRVYMIGYYNWGEAAATITYEASFKAEEINVAPIDKDKSNVVLELGANTVDLLENTIVSLYEFVPAEPGIYTITVGDGVTMATYSFTEYLIAEAQNGVVVHTATAAEQTILIGLTADAASVTVTIEKTGNYTPPAQTVYENYVPTNTVVSNFTDPTGLVNVDVNKDQTVVLGSDGYYHLGSATGPIIYVNLNNEQFTLAMLYAAGAPITMRGTYVDEAGKEQHYDFMNMITTLYYDYSKVNDYHPLNKDLMIFLKAYGASQGWYNTNTSSFASITSGAFKADSAWLASCYSTVSYAEPSTDTGSNTGTNTGSNTVTGDNSPLMLMIALMMLSACGGVLALVSKKKFAR